MDCSCSVTFAFYLFAINKKFKNNSKNKTNGKFYHLKKIKENSIKNSRLLTPDIKNEMKNRHKHHDDPKDLDIN